jgi:nitrogen-specific signal transduction histidine kinase
MNEKESLKLAGRIVSVNTADQSVLLESTDKSNRLRVYAVNEQFKRLTHIITESRFNGVNAKELTGTFYIQGKVLVQFSMGNGLSEWSQAFHAAFKEYFANPKEFLAK